MLFDVELESNVAAAAFFFFAFCTLLERIMDILSWHALELATETSVEREYWMLYVHWNGVYGLFSLSAGFFL